MAIHLPQDLANSIRAEILSGQFASEDELVAAAARDYLRRKHRQPRHLDHDEEQPGAQELQRRLVEAGVLSEIKPPISDLTPYRQRQTVAIQGEPLSETVLHERR